MKKHYSKADKRNPEGKYARELSKAIKQTALERKIKSIRTKEEER